MHPTTGTAPWIPQMYPDMCFQSVALVDSGEKSSSTSASPPEKQTNKNNRWTNVLIHLLHHLAVEMQIRQTLSTDSNATILWCGQFFLSSEGRILVLSPTRTTYQESFIRWSLCVWIGDHRLFWSGLIVIQLTVHNSHLAILIIHHPLKQPFDVWIPYDAHLCGLLSLRDACLFPFTQYLPTQNSIPPYKTHKLDTTNFFAW